MRSSPIWPSRLMGRPHNLQSVVADDLIKDLLGKVTSQEPSGEDRLTRLKSVFDKFLSELAGTEAAAQVPPPPAPNA